MRNTKRPQKGFEIPAQVKADGTKGYCEPGTRSGVFTTGRLQFLTFSDSKDLHFMIAKELPANTVRKQCVRCVGNGLDWYPGEPTVTCPMCQERGWAGG